MKASNASSDEKGLVLDFIDPLFAVAIHISLVEGLMRTGWYVRWKDGTSTYPTLCPDDVFNLFVLILGYVFVFTSWVGYHRSVKKKPIRDETAAGYVRFVIDIVLLVVYSLMLAVFEHFQAVLALVVVSFALYMAWDAAKAVEYPSSGVAHRESKYRQGVSIFWFVCFVLLWFSSLWGESPKARCLILFVAFLFAILYRVSKVPLFCYARGSHMAPASELPLPGSGANEVDGSKGPASDIDQGTASGPGAGGDSDAAVGTSVSVTPRDNSSVDASTDRALAVLVISVEPTTITIAQGGGASLRAISTPGGGVLEEEVTAGAVWKSESEAVASVDGGRVKAHESGRTFISASYSGAEARVQVTVEG